MSSRLRFVSAVISAIVILAAIGGAIWWRSLSERSEGDGLSSVDNAFVGISTEMSSSQEGFDGNNIFWSSPSGVGGFMHTLPPVYNPYLQRVHGGFAAPGKDAIAIFDTELNIVAELPVENLGTGTLSSAAGSENGQYAIFSFNEGEGGQPDARRIVLASADAAHTIRRPNLVQAVTACADGSARWIEYVPISNSDPLGPGTASLATWTPGSDVELAKINEHFEIAPSAESSLSCSREFSYIDARTKNGVRHVLKIASTRQSTSILGKYRLPELPPSNGSRFTYTHNAQLFTLTSRGELTKTDLFDQRIKYKKALPVPGLTVLSSSFDGDFVYLVVKLSESDTRQAVIQVSLNDPACVSEPVLLHGYDSLSGKASIFRGNSSTKVALTVLPLHRNVSLPCSK